MSNPSPGWNHSTDLLLVEDNPGDVRLVREAFKDAHLVNTLHVAADGDEALDFIYQRGEYTDAPRPNLVLLDWNLPHTSGEEVLAELKDDEDLRSIPVIVLTSSQADEDVIRSYELQANAYVTKPVDPDEFTDTVCSFEEFWLEIVRLPSTVDDT